MHKELEGRCVELAAKLLEIASDKFSNHGCNDVDAELLEMFTHDELVEIDRSIAIWNGDASEHDPERLTFVHADWILMSFLADTILQHAAKLLDDC